MSRYGADNVKQPVLYRLGDAILRFSTSDFSRSSLSRINKDGLGGDGVGWYLSSYSSFILSFPSFSSLRRTG